MKLGFIGFGEAAYHLCVGLGQEGSIQMCATDKMAQDPNLGSLILRRAADAGVTLVSSATQAVDWADIVFAAVPSSVTMEACREAKGALRPGQIYADVSASTPRTKQSIWEALQETGVLFVDAAMLGSLPKDKHKVPITASGNGAEAFRAAMTPYGMNISVIGETAGSASAIKLVRSVYMKGLSMLMLEMMLAADAYGITEEVVSSISRSLDRIPFVNHLDRLVASSAIHCRRRAAELKGSEEMLREEEIPSRMTAAAKEWLEALENYDFPSARPGGWQAVVEAMRKTERREQKCL